MGHKIFDGTGYDEGGFLAGFPVFPEPAAPAALMK